MTHSGVILCGRAGIGKSLAWKLASQGLNVVIVAYPDSVLDNTEDEMKSAFPQTQIRKVLSCNRKDAMFLSEAQVGVNLSGNNYLDAILEATKDIDVQIIFCNAGYLVTGFFHST